ncbi:MAG: hypothetical protein GX769_02730 [Erysipelothrix sp.]|nr:hypothetical protein [Erysipelothrix sp.]
MNKGFSLVEVLIGIVLSFFVLDLCLSVFTYTKTDLKDYSSQDLISSFQIHQILNLSTEIDVFEDEISFRYLNEIRTLYFVNDKVTIKPGTLIFFIKVDRCLFFVEDEKIYIKLFRNTQESVFLIGLL